MTWAVWAPLLAPLLAVPAARRLSDILPPRAAALLLTLTAAVLAALGAGALALLTAAGLLRLPVLAALGHVSAVVMRRSNPVDLPIGMLAALALGTAALAVLRAGRRHRRDLLHATGAAERHGGAGDLTVLPDPGADAYALPGLPGHPGRVVVTAGMLRELDPQEREVLLAHERAHLRGRHHLLIVCADLAGCLHPVLRALREPLSFHVERWADESAAKAVGDRRLTARAVGRAALAASAAPARRRPAVALAAAAGPIPRRVAALLATPQPRGRWPRVLADRPGAAVGVLLAACVFVSGVSALEAAQDLHAHIESAQTQEAGAHTHWGGHTHWSAPGHLRTPW